jgi:hypothetical protein
MEMLNKHIYYIFFFFGLSVAAFGISFYSALQPEKESFKTDKQALHGSLFNMDSEGFMAGDNPGFIDVRDIVPACALSQTLDDGIRPVLNSVFGSARLKDAGQCIESARMVLEYVPEKKFNSKAGTELYKKMIASGLEAGKPRYSAARKVIEIAVSGFAKRKNMPVEIVLDLEKQVARVETGSIGEPNQN